MKILRILFLSLLLIGNWYAGMVLAQPGPKQYLRVGAGPASTGPGGERGIALSTEYGRRIAKGLFLNALLTYGDVRSGRQNVTYLSSSDFSLWPGLTVSQAAVLNTQVGLSIALVDSPRHLLQAGVGGGLYYLSSTYFRVASPPVRDTRLEARQSWQPGGYVQLGYDYRITERFGVGVRAYGAARDKIRLTTVQLGASVQF